MPIAKFSDKYKPAVNVSRGVAYSTVLSCTEMSCHVHLSCSVLSCVCVSPSAFFVFNMKKSAQRRRKHCALAVVRRSQKFSARCRPLPRGAVRPKFNQLEMVTTFTYKPETQFGEDRCTQFRVIVVTDAQTFTHTNSQTGTITIHCAAASLARSVRSLQSATLSSDWKPAEVTAI